MIVFTDTSDGWLWYSLKYSAKKRWKNTYPSLSYASSAQDQKHHKEGKQLW